MQTKIYALIMYIVLSHVVFAMKETASLLGVLTILMVVFMPVLYFQAVISNEFITGLISFIVVVFLIFISIYHKLLNERSQIRREFLILNYIGYYPVKLKIIFLKKQIIYIF